MDSRLLLANIQLLLRMYTLFKSKVGISWSQVDGIVWLSFGKLMEINYNKLESLGLQNLYSKWVDNFLYWLQRIVRNGFIFGIWEILLMDNLIPFMFLKVLFDILQAAYVVSDLVKVLQSEVLKVVAESWL